MPARIPLALAWLALVALAGSALAANFEAGMAAANRRDFAGAARHWRPLAEAGEARAQYHLGTLYEDGQGVGRDHGEAARWYRLAAEGGDGRARNALAILTIQGQGVARDPAEAFKWFALSARAGNGFAGRNLAKLEAMLNAEELAEGERRLAAFLAREGGG